MKFLLLVLAIAFSTMLHGKQTVCLNMIVKDESHVIERCLGSVKDLIDYWVIVDTGSTDNTIEVIKNYLKDIPGEIHERAWVNFEHNRNEALDLARNKSNYILFMDADDWLETTENFQLPDLNKDAYCIWWEHSASFRYLKQQIIKNTLHWKWEGVLHEYLTCNKNYESETLENIKYVFGADGARWKDPEKYMKCARTFEDALIKDPQNSRYTFYLAESYRDCGEKRKALETYEKRIRMGGWDQETFWAMLQAAHLKKDLGESQESVVRAFLLAHRFRPHRPEPICFLAELYNQTSQFQKAYQLIMDWKSKNHKNSDALFNLTWTADYGIEFQLSLAAYYLGRYTTSLEACNRLLAFKDLPEGFRQQALANKEFIINKLPESIDEETNKTVLIAILPKNQEHSLPAYLRCIENLNYKKELISIYINTHGNSDNTEKVLKEWVKKHKHEYRKVIYEKDHLNSIKTQEGTLDEQRGAHLAAVKQKSLHKAQELKCDFYLVADCSNFLMPNTLRYLIAKDKPIIAPLLRAMPDPEDLHSNFFYATTSNGYFANHPDYYAILKGEKKGTFKVPVVHQTYLIKTNYIDQLSYQDDTSEWEFIVFSRNAEKKGIEQYICNEIPFGTILHVDSDQTLQDEKIIFACLLYKNPCIENFFYKDSSPQLVSAQPSAYTPLQIHEKTLSECKDPESTYYTLIAIAQTQAQEGMPIERVIKSYKRACHYRPKKADAYFHLSKFYREQKLFKKGYKTALKGMRMIPTASTDDDWFTKCGLQWEFALNAHSLGIFEEAVDATLKLLSQDLLESNRAVLTKNLFYHQCGEHTMKIAHEKWGAFPERKVANQSEQPSQSKLHICTHASHYTQNLKQLVHSCEYNGLNLQVLGLGEPFNVGKKIQSYGKYIATLPDDHIVMCVDAYDVLFTADEKTILETFYAFNKPCIFSAEVGCHPYPHLARYYGESPTKFKYLNSGSFIGYVKELKEIFKLMGTVPDVTDDQGWFTMLYLYHPELITLDLECELFLPLYAVHPSELLVDFDRKKISHSETKKSTCLVHGNGEGKILYQQIYDILFRKDFLMGRIPSDNHRYEGFKKVFELLEQNPSKTIVEIGTARAGSRSFIWEGGSTILFTEWAHQHKADFYTVDLSDRNLKEAASSLPSFINKTHFVQDDSIHFLTSFQKEIDFLYLDSIDVDHSNPLPCQQQHLKELQAAYDKLSKNCIIMINDCGYTPKTPWMTHGGKGKLAIEFLLQKGWEIAFDDYQVILVRGS